MDIAALGRREVATVDEAASLRQAARLMRERHVGALVVTREHGDTSRLAGVVTDRDLALQALAGGLDADTTPVGAIAGDSLVSLPQSASVADALAAMREAGVRRLVLVDEQRHLAGIVSLDDLLPAVAAELGELADILRRGMAREVAEAEAGAQMAPAAPRRIVVPDELAAMWRRVVEP